MIDKIVKIKSGVDINSPQFKKYYMMLKQKNKNSNFLDFALEQNSKVLSDPICFEESEYIDFNVDDLSFIWYENEIIGHTLTNIKKTRFSIPTSSGTKNHLDEKIKEKDGIKSYSKIEQVVLDDFCSGIVMDSYLYNRIHGKMEGIGSLKYEKTIKKQKI